MAYYASSFFRINKKNLSLDEPLFKETNIIYDDNDKINDNVIEKFFYCCPMLYLLMGYLDIKSIGYLSLTNKTIHLNIRNTPTRMVTQLLYNIFSRYYYITRNIINGTGVVNSALYIDLDDVYTFERTKCIYTSKFLSVVDENLYQSGRLPICKTLDNIYSCNHQSDINSTHIVNALWPILMYEAEDIVSNLIARDYPLYQMISDVECSIMNSIFKDFSITLYPIKLLLSFGNIGIDSSALLTVTLSTLLDHTNDVVNKYSEWTSLSTKIDNDLWQKIKINYKLDPKNVKIDKLTYDKNAPIIQMNSSVDFYRFLQSKFLVDFWFRFIDWTHHIIMGGVLFTGIIYMNNVFNNEDCDMDIFSYGIPYNKFIQHIQQFETKLVKNGIDYVKVKMNCAIFTIYLQLQAEHKPIKIQFIFTCVNATISQILLSFDLSCTQIAFNPFTFNISFTHAFLDFIRSGFVRIFNYRDYNYNDTRRRSVLELISMNRILKYKQKGISYFQIPKNICIHYIEKSLCNVIEIEKTRYLKHTRFALKLKIDDNETDYISKHYDMYGSKGHIFLKQNYDETHMLLSTLQHIFQHWYDNQQIVIDNESCI